MNIQNKSIIVYVPDSLENNNVGFLPGFIRKDGHDVKFYINDNTLKNECTGCIGYCGLAQVQPFDQPPTYWIRVSFSDGQFQVSHILSDQIQEYKLLYVFYDFEAFKESNLTSSLKPNNEFYYLSESLSNKKTLLNSYSFIRTLCKLMIWIIFNIRYLCKKTKTLFKPLNNSSAFQHIEDTLHQIHCILDDVEKQRTFSTRTRHVVITRIIDIFLGILVLQWLFSHRDSNAIEHTEEFIIRIGDLLRFLMGSPVGLKLNAAFNKTLGSFFLYHMTLWNTFLKTAASVVNIGTIGESTLVIVCSFGLTQQLAIASDLLALTTFHVHCIYVYAARLYGAQIYGLIALWRLFLGHKRNPLKGRVDSYKYSSRQLFVGTLAFTVLLFLLPTTALYYVVFVTFRIILLSISKTLKMLRTAALEAPIYLTCLWLVNSSKIKSQVHITARQTSGALALDATLKSGSWRMCCLKQNFVISTSLDISEKARKLGLFTTILYGDLF